MMEVDDQGKEELTLTPKPDVKDLYVFLCYSVFCFLSAFVAYSTGKNRETEVPVAAADEPKIIDRYVHLPLTSDFALNLLSQKRKG